MRAFMARFSSIHCDICNVQLIRSTNLSWSPEGGNSWAVPSDWIRLTSRRAIPEMPRGIPEIPRRVRETENGNWSFLLKPLEDIPMRQIEYLFYIRAKARGKGCT